MLVVVSSAPATAVTDGSDPAIDAVESYIEGSKSGRASDDAGGTTSLVMLVGFMVLLAVVFLVVARRLRRPPSR